MKCLWSRKLLGSLLISKEKRDVQGKGVGVKIVSQSESGNRGPYILIPYIYEKPCWN